MSHTETIWDALAPKPKIAASETDPPKQWYDVDNILLAEPVIIEYLAAHTASPADSRLLDFGCGDGQFTSRLHELGYKAEGIDPSPSMIAAAQDKYSETLPFTIGGFESLPNEATYDSITAVMVMQFIPDVKPVMQRLAAALKPGGSLVVAAFNPEFISDWIRTGNPDYVGFDSVDNPTEGTLLFGPVEVPVYVRTAAQYIELAAEDGLSLALEAYPPFSDAFLEQYPVDGPVEHAEHMILAFQKAGLHDD
jgi:2-polyprenyl-3-methyl-5-hydroxy-6-metoxy-1,4-benzoquinol methylase